MNRFHLLYIPCKDQEEAQRIASHLLEDRLIACANILPGMISMYRWQGKLTSTQESLLLAKTTEEHLEKIRKTVCEAHSYDCPCVVSWPLDSGNKDFLHWIQSEVQPR